MEGKKPIEILFSDASLTNLSEDFKAKASVLFESAVQAEVAKEKLAMEESYKAKLDEQRKELETAIEAKVDSYLTYVAEEWMKENELAVENGIQVEIAENFLKGMKDLFTESYIEIPKNKVNVVAEMTAELKKKSDSLDEAIDKNIELKAEIVKLKKASIVEGIVKDMADTQKEKLNGLIEMVDFESEEQFSGRVKNIVETYFKSSVNESDDDDEDDKPGMKEKEDDDEDDKKEKKEKKEKTDESMKRYVEALSLSVK